MAQSSITEIRELSNEELQARLGELKQEGLNLRLQQATERGLRRPNLRRAKRFDQTTFRVSRKRSVTIRLDLA